MSSPQSDSKNPTQPTAEIDIVGIGNAMMDVVCHTSDEQIATLQLQKGVMTLIDADRAEELYAKMSCRVECSGGSVANSMAGLASLGVRAGYIGKVKNDPLGTKFCQDIAQAGVQCAVCRAESGPPTGRCMVFVTPDAARTMQTFLGASSTLTPQDIDPEVIRSAAIVYLEGYLFDPPPAREAFYKTAEIAHAAHRKVALSLSDSWCVDRHRDSFLEFVKKHVDVLFANEEEAQALNQSPSLDQAIEILKRQCRLTVITKGARGSLLVTSDRVYSVDPEPCRRVIDTTGAGDLFASGFLFGLTQGKELSVCGRLGSIVAAEIVSHFGARPKECLRTLVNEKLDSL